MAGIFTRGQMNLANQYQVGVKITMARVTYPELAFMEHTMNVVGFCKKWPVRQMADGKRQIGAYWQDFHKKMAEYGENLDDAQFFQFGFRHSRLAVEVIWTKDMVYQRASCMVGDLDLDWIMAALLPAEVDWHEAKEQGDLKKIMAQMD